MFKRILKNQNGQLVAVLAIGVVVFGSMFYMWKHVNLSQKSYQKQNDKVELEIISINILERVKNALAGKTNCLTGDLRKFKNLKSQQIKKESQQYTNLQTISNCLIPMDEKAMLSKINLEINTADIPNPDLLQTNLQISLEILSKDKKSSLKRHRNVNLTVASLASFGIMQTSPNFVSPLIAIDPGATAHIYSRTFIRSDQNVNINNLYLKNVFYKMPIFIKASAMKLPAAYSASYIDSLKNQLGGGIRSNAFSQVQNFLTDYPAYWNWDIDVSKLYDGSGYLLPVSGMALKETGVTGGNFYNSLKASFTEVNQKQNSTNALESSFIASTCEDTGLQAKTFIFMNASKDFTIDFTGSDKAFDKLPIFCGLIMAKNLIIKLDSKDAKLPHLLMGLFFVSNQIQIIGTSGSVYFVNPLEQNPLPPQLMGLLDKNFQLSQIKNISQLSTNIGKNFTLPIYKSPSQAHQKFKGLTPASLKDPALDLLAKTDCPTPSSSSHYCWKSTVTKPDPLLIFDNNGLNNLIFEITDQL